MFKFVCCLSLILLAVLLSCSKSNEADLRGLGQGATERSCDTVNVKFNADIVPLMKAHCNSCHNTARAFGSVNTATYSGLKVIADNGLLVGTITHGTGFFSMPLGSAKLESCDIDKIRAWVNGGTKND